jgi:hypothetical protein
LLPTLIGGGQRLKRIDICAAQPKKNEYLFTFKNKKAVPLIF